MTGSFRELLSNAKPKEKPRCFFAQTGPVSESSRFSRENGSRSTAKAFLASKAEFRRKNTAEP
jgi:hypothetical protein